MYCMTLRKTTPDNTLTLFTLGPVVRRIDNPIRWINLYPVESTLRFVNSYLLDSVIRPLDNWAQVAIYDLVNYNPPVSTLYFPL